MLLPHREVAEIVWRHAKKLGLRYDRSPQTHPNGGFYLLAVDRAVVTLVKVVFS